MPYRTFAVAIGVALLVVNEYEETLECGGFEESGDGEDEGVVLVPVVGEGAVCEGGEEGEVACGLWRGCLEAEVQILDVAE